MKKIISIYVILLSIIYAQGLDRNIDQFKTNSFIRPVAKDSIEVLSFVEVSSNALQFLKKDNLFEAKYEVNIAILNDDNEKKSSQLFSDTIIVKKFGDTTSKIKKKIITTAFVLPFDNYTVTSSLKDLDVKLSGKKEQEINLKYLSKSTSLKIYEPIFLKEGKGSWGFGLNKFPTVANRVISDNNIISLNQYIVLNPGAYNITMSVISQKTVQWEDSIDAVSQGDVVSHLANIPIKDIDKRDLTIKVVVTQNDSVSSKSFSFKIKNTMLFDGIDNIDTALAQMSIS